MHVLYNYICSSAGSMYVCTMIYMHMNTCRVGMCIVCTSTMLAVFQDEEYSSSIVETDNRLLQSVTLPSMEDSTGLGQHACT